MLSKRLYLMALAVLCVALLGMHSTCCTGSADEPLGGGEEPAAADGGAGTDQGDAGSTGDRRDGGGGNGDAPLPDAFGPEDPPRVCRTPKGLPAGGPYFKNISKEVGFAAGGIEPLGRRIAAADLDGDGYPDLIIQAPVNNKREDYTSSPPKRYRWVLLNRPHPTIKGRRIFIDHTVASNFTATRDGGKGRYSQFAAFADVNNDGVMDVFSAAYVDIWDPAKNPDPGDRNEIVLGGKGASYKLATKSDIFTTKGMPTTGATFLDYDRDGMIDLFVGYWYEHYGSSLNGTQDRLYRGAGDGTFKDVTKAVGLETTADGFDQGTNHRPTYGVTSCDVDGNGQTDLIVSAYGRQLNMLYVNKDGKFTEIGRPSGVAADDKVSPKDNEFYRCWCHKTQKCLGLGVPKPKLDLQSCLDKYWQYWNPSRDEKPYRTAGNTFTTVCGDLNNDGKMDLYHAEIRHWWAGSSSDPTQVLLNVSTPGQVKFKRMANTPLGLSRAWGAQSWNEGDIMAGFLDFDNDGRKDIFLGSSDYPEQRAFLFRQIKNMIFQEVAVTGKIAHSRASGIAFIDIDLDGDLDVVVGSSTARCSASEGCPWKKTEVHVYENLVGQSSNWVSIRLKGKGQGGTNAAGIGARVSVTAGGVTQVVEVSGGYGHFGIQHDTVAHFGLGAACDIEKVEVRWQDKKGTVQTWRNVRANYHVTLSEGSGKVEYRAK